MKKNAADRGHNYYNELGISNAATLDDIKDAYRRMAKLYHPDVNPSEDARLRYANIQKAYQVLSDPDERLQYDKSRGILQVEANNDFIASTKQLRKELQFATETEKTTYLKKDNKNEETGVLNKLMSFFKGDSQSDSPQDKEATKRKSKDVLPERERIFNFAVSEIEAITGTTRTIVIRQVGKEVRREINIPPVDISPSKIKIRLPRPEGKTGIDEVCIQVSIMNTPNFKREGNDIHIKIPVLESEMESSLSLTIATALGFETISLNSKNLTVPFIISSGGLWDPENAVHGDIFVTASQKETNGSKTKEKEIKDERESILLSLSPLKIKRNAQESSMT